jgi:hypothetical protein
VSMKMALMMEAVQTSETLVNSYQCTRRYNPEDSHFHYCVRKVSPLVPTLTAYFA